eukprot:scaffold171194_cov33-Tisochrysis_lutea.AAC.2
MRAQDARRAVATLDLCSTRVAAEQVGTPRHPGHTVDEHVRSIEESQRLCEALDFPHKVTPSHHNVARD